MTTDTMITELTKTVSNLQRDVEMLKEDKDYFKNKTTRRLLVRTLLRVFLK